MNELLKTKYYGLIKSDDYVSYGKIGIVIASIEDQLILSDNTVSKDHLIEILLPIKETENDLYNEMLKDIDSGLIYGRY
ncbi:MAG: hypothetical protein WC343_03565 [Bacilli bacterium]|jgi:hypothetical protein